MLNKKQRQMPWLGKLKVRYYSMLQWLMMLTVSKNDILRHVGYRSPTGRKMLLEKIIYEKYFEKEAGKNYDTIWGKKYDADTQD